MRIEQIGHSTFHFTARISKYSPLSLQTLNLNACVYLRQSPCLVKGTNHQTNATESEPMPTRTQTSIIALPPGIRIDHPLEMLDRNYIWNASSIGVQYVFESMVDAERLITSLQALLREIPALAGRTDFEQMCITEKGAGVPFEQVFDYPGAASDYSDMHQVQRNRSDFVIEPKRQQVEKGTGALMAVKLTHFAAGGCILGVTINHVLMDATGVHLVMKRWSQLFQGKNQGTELLYGRTLFRFGGSHNPPQLHSRLKQLNLAVPPNFNTLWGKLIKFVMFFALDRAKKMDRELFHFSPEQVERIKQQVTQESGEPWLSTNVAMGAHLAKIMLDLQFGQRKIDVLQLTNILSLRGKINPDQQDLHSRFAGNAMYVMVSPTALNKRACDIERGEFARILKRAFNEADADFIRERMDAVVDCLENGYAYPGFNLLKPIIGLNNQSKIDVYGVDFGAGELQRVIPQDVGDNILMFPAKDGGIDVYLRNILSAKQQKLLLSKPWDDRLYQP